MTEEVEREGWEEQEHGEDRRKSRRCIFVMKPD
jgi:hypothetical protein